MVISQISGSTVEVKNVFVKRDQVNSQNSITLSYIDIKNRKDAKSYGGVDISFSDGVLNLKNIVSINDNQEKELTKKELVRQNRYYIVRPGDNIIKIANKFNVSEKTIIIENKIKSNLIKPGQELRVLPISGVTHKIVKGDNILSLAKQYKVKEENIVDFNNLGGELKIGDKIVIPDGDKSIDIKDKYIPNYQIKKKRAVAYKVKKSSYVRYSSAKRTYGVYTHPLPGSFRVRGITKSHKGVDMAAAIGTPILSVAAGTVIKATSYGWNQGCGKTVYIKHNNGTRALYCHSSKILVSKGQYIVKGQKISEVGSTGNSTGPHLHFELRGARNPF